MDLVFGRARRAGGFAAAAAAAAVLLAGCGSAGPHPATGGRVTVVAAENTWGSLAAQLGGDRAAVTSVIANPATDPHDYEPTAADARALADSQLAIVNGAGYDPWAAKLLSADPSPDRIVLTVADLVRVPQGGNPHRWYSPPDVHRVVDRITADLARLDPHHAAYFEVRHQALLRNGLARYDALIESIRRRFAGAPVGASESIVAPLAKALGLRLITPPELLNAIAEGAEPTAEATATAQQQIAGRRIDAWIYDAQNATPDVQRLTSQARARGIPVTAVTETLTPQAATFQSWQIRQLQALSEALARGAR